jgi:hypothetical protein
MNLIIINIDRSQKKKLQKKFGVICIMLKEILPIFYSDM